MQSDRVNLRAGGSKGCDHEVLKAEFLLHRTCHKVHMQKSGFVQLSIGICDTGNDHSEGIHDDGKMKLLSDSGKNGEERQDQERNESTLWPLIIGWSGQ